MSYPDHEPYEVSARFFLAMQAKALSLELDARQDALLAANLTDPGHLRRQNRLVDAQRAEAERYRSFLADVRIRVK